MTKRRLKLPIDDAIKFYDDEYNKANTSKSKAKVYHFFKQSDGSISDVSGDVEDHVVSMVDRNDYDTHIRELEATIERQAEAIDKLKNQRDGFALMVTEPSKRNQLWRDLNVVVESILKKK